MVLRQRSLADYSPEGRKELDTTEVTEHTHAHIDLHFPFDISFSSRVKGSREVYRRRIDLWIKTGVSQLVRHRPRETSVGLETHNSP